MSLLGNVAEQTQAGIAESRARDRKLEDEARAEENAITRAQRMAEVKQTMDEQARQKLMERTSQQMQQAEEGGAELTSAQRLKELQGAGVGDASTLTPEQEAMISAGRGLKYNTPLAQIGNQLTAARKGGLYDAEAQLEQARKETLAAIAAAQKERREDAKEALSEARYQETVRNNNLQHNASMARIDASEKRANGGGGSQTEKISTQLGVLNRTIDSIEEKIKNGMEISNAEKSTLDRATTARDNLVAKISDLNPGTKEQGNTANKKADAPKKDGASPAPAQSSAGLPPANMLKEGQVTYFKGKGGYTLVNGQPVKVK